MRYLLASLSLTLVLAACTGVTPEPESELGTQARSTQQIEPQAKSFIQDPEAKGGEAAILYKTGQKATFKLNEVASGAYKVSVRARAEAYEGYPVMRLHRNGERLGEDNPVKREGYGEGAQKFGEVELAAGDVLVAEFTNDLYGGSADKDRNLVVDHLILEPVEGGGADDGASSLPVELRGEPSVSKKLIEYGWDRPTAEYVRDNIGMMEERPFDGVTFMIGEEPHAVFEARRWAEQEMKLDVLADIEWDTFTDNFLILYANTDPKWFDDAHWDTVTANMRLISKAVEAAGAKGVFIDPEYYGKSDCSPWRYEIEDTCDYGGRSFQEVEAKVRERGEQFVRALQSEVETLNLFWLDFVSETYVNVSIWEQNPTENGYALLRAFAEGMLAGADDATRLTDGLELGYWFKSSLAYPAYYEAASVDVLDFVTEEYKERYQSKVDLAYATFLDCYFVVPKMAEKFPTCDQGLSETDQAKWLEHNVYNALLHSDEYVWLYSQAGDRIDANDDGGESMDWWSEPTYNVPPGAQDAVRRAREKYAAGEALGFDMVLDEPWGDDVRDWLPWKDTARTRVSEALEVTLDTDLSGRDLRGEATSNGDTERVEFYLNAQLVNTESEAPYAFELTDLPPGEHTLYARVFAPNGEHGTSKPATVNIP